MYHVIPAADSFYPVVDHKLQGSESYSKGPLTICLGRVPRFIESSMVYIMLLGRAYVLPGRRPLVTGKCSIIYRDIVDVLQGCVPCATGQGHVLPVRSTWLWTIFFRAIEHLAHQFNIGCGHVLSCRGSWGTRTWTIFYQAINHMVQDGVLCATRPWTWSSDTWDMSYRALDHILQGNWPSDSWLSGEGHFTWTVDHEFSSPGPYSTQPSITCYRAIYRMWTCSTRPLVMSFGAIDHVHTM